MLLFLNDIAGSEVLVILIFILIFFGSKSIPGIAQTLGRTIRQLRDASDEMKNEIRKSAGSLDDIKKDLNLSGMIRDTERDVQQPLDQYVSDINEAISYRPPKKEMPQTQPNPFVQPENTDIDSVEMPQQINAQSTEKLTIKTPQSLGNNEISMENKPVEKDNMDPAID